MSKEEEYRELLAEFVGGVYGSEGSFISSFCCCGEGLADHGYSNGHSPVDAGNYWFNDFVKRVEETLERTDKNG